MDATEEALGAESARGNKGATDITIKWKGEVIDSYLQGRSMRNFPSFQNYWKQLDLF